MGISADLLCTLFIVPPGTENRAQLATSTEEGLK